MSSSFRYLDLYLIAILFNVEFFVLLRIRKKMKILGENIFKQEAGTENFQKSSRLLSFLDNGLLRLLS